MLNKLYGWLETSFAQLREDAPSPEDAVAQRAAAADDRLRRKRPLECLEGTFDQDSSTIKRTRMGDIIDAIKVADEGMRSHTSGVTAGMRETVHPGVRKRRPASHGLSLGLEQPSTSAAAWGSDRMPADETFASTSTTLESETSKSETVCSEKASAGSKVHRRRVCMSSTHRDLPKTNGHSFTSSPFVASKLQPSPRLGRPLNLRPNGITSSCSGLGTTSSSCTSMYEKTFPIKVMQSPGHSTSPGRVHKTRPRCSAQESVRKEERMIYQQLLSQVSGGQKTFLHNGSSHSIMGSYRDFTRFQSSSHIRKKFSSPAGSAAGETSEGTSGPPSPRALSSQSSTTLPSPPGPSRRLESHTSFLDNNVCPSNAATFPSALQVNCAQDTQSPDHDQDSVIIISEKKSEKQDSSSVHLLHVESWVKELTSMYDSRARERQRRIEEKQALATQLLQERLSEQVQRRPDVEVHIRVPLEKEVPLTAVIEQPKSLVDKPELPELTQEMEAEVDRVLHGDSPHEVLSEGFGLSLTRKDLHTLSKLNWLNDEVINFYMNLLVERSKDPGLPSVTTFNTFFYPKLLRNGYSAVRRWTKRTDIFAKDILLVPVHLGMHWCLLVVDFRKKTVEYFDSMGGNNDKACTMLLDYLMKESKDKKGKELSSGWTVHSKKPNEIPQQRNGSDCGMFTCKYADYITKDRPITFSQIHMPYFRRRMVWEIVNHKLL